MLGPPVSRPRHVITLDDVGLSPGGPRRSPPVWAIVLMGTGAVVAVVVVLQLALPMAAAWLVERRLGGDAEVDVRAVPALALLVGRADRVSITADHLGGGGGGDGATSGPGGIGHLHRADELDLSARIVTAPSVTLRDVVVRKRGQDVTLSATAQLAGSPAVRAAGAEARVGLDDRRESGLELRGQAAGVSRAVGLRLEAAGGGVELRADSWVGGLLAVTVFEHPGLEVISIRSEPTAGDELRLRAIARVR